MICEWCGRELNSFYLIYKGKTFCEDNYCQCIKNYLYEQADEEIYEYRADGETKYDMSEVCESE